MLATLQGHTNAVWGVALSGTGGWWPVPAQIQRSGYGTVELVNRWPAWNITPVWSGASR